MSAEIKNLYRRCLTDIKVELDEEFDNNFDRQGFFGKKWPARNPDLDLGRAVLVKSGALRRDTRSRLTSRALVYTNPRPYARIHNEGGKITVTKKMRGYFWARHYQARGGMTRTKSGTYGKNARNNQLNAKAEFWRNMALKPIGSKIEIQERKFIGKSPKVDKLIKEITRGNVEAFFNQYVQSLKNKL